MKTHNLLQGSPEWLAYRAQHFNASDAPAMMGCSPYKTRAELLREMHTGVVPDVGADTQRAFDNGHRFEALARPMAEDIIGEDLYPVTGSEGRYSASFDGLTLGEDIVFEHKSANADLRAILADDSTPLPLHYRVQMEQQLMVSGAGRALFMATLWNGDQCTFSGYRWYTPDAELRAAILRGWDQLAADLAAYTLPPTTEPARAEPMESLPAVAVRLDGALTVAGNLPTFAAALKAFIARMPAKPATDNDFATVDAACKSLKKAEEALDAAEAGALASITDVEAMRRAVADCRKLARDTRLAAEKMVERRKAEVKEHAVMAARRALDDHIAGLNAELAPMQLQPVAADFGGSIKGLRSIASMQDALDTTLANAKIAADAQARTMRGNIVAFKAAATGLEFLFADLGVLIHKAADDFAAAMSARIVKHRADEAEKARKAAEAEALRIAAAEQRAREQAEREAAQRLADERAKIAQAEEARVAEQKRQQANAEREAQHAAVARAEAASAPAYFAATVSPQPALIARAVEIVNDLIAAEVVRDAINANEPATLKLGTICERLGFTVSAAFVADVLHVAPARTEGRAVLYRESQWPVICGQLASHVRAMAELYAAEPA